MIRIIKKLTLSAALLLVIPYANSSNLEACDTAECREYFKAYKILTKRGHSDAMATLGEFYYAGYGTEKNDTKALKWFRRAAKYDNTVAQYKAGVMYLQESDYQDIDKGISYLKKSTKVDFSPSSLVLGKVYLGGHLVEQDQAEADLWLSKAYSLNNTEARTFARQLKDSEDAKNLSLPKLFSLLQANRNAQEGQNAPIGEMETITVTAPDYSKYFNEQIARLNNSRPDTESGTGTNIAGRSCAEMWGCSSEGDSERIRDVLLSDWGLVALIFRNH